MRLKVLSEIEDERLVKNIAEKISEIYGLETTVVKSKLKDVEKSYNRKRRQYNAEVLLEEIKFEKSYVLVVTDRDIYVPGLNFVFGYAPGPTGIVSIYRLNPLRMGGIYDFELLMARAVKEAVHEVGHMLGLRHCTTPCCVMNFSNSVREVDLKGFRPCENCIKKAISSTV